MPDPVLPATLYLLVGGLVILLGGVILRDSAGDRIRRVTGLLLLLVGLKALFEGMSFAVVRTAGGAAPDTRALRIFGYLWELFFPTLVLFAAIFPRDAKFLSRFRLSVPFLYLPHTFHFLVLVFLGEDRLALPDLPQTLDYLRVPYKVGGYLINRSSPSSCRSSRWSTSATSRWPWRCSTTPGARPRTCGCAASSTSSSTGWAAASCSTPWPSRSAS
jgi:hypothetical protein